MGYDRGDSFPFDFEANGNPFGLKLKENCHHDHISFNVKGIGSIVFSVYTIYIIILYHVYVYYYLNIAMTDLEKLSGKAFPKDVS